MNYPTPSVGRQVWYYPVMPKAEADFGNVNGPWAATVIKVIGAPWEHSPFSPVNLLVISPDTGDQFLVTNVRMSPSPVPGDRFEWMPYQVEQHNKAIAKEIEAKARIERGLGLANCYAPKIACAQQKVGSCLGTIERAEADRTTY